MLSKMLCGYYVHQYWNYNFHVIRKEKKTEIPHHYLGFLCHNLDALFLKSAFKPALKGHYCAPVLGTETPFRHLIIKYL